MLEVTGERVIPNRQAGELVVAEHVARYRWAAPLVPGRRVLDAACGDGYGTAILAGAGAESVIGIDLSAETVVHARERYGLNFVEADVADLPIADDAIDAIISFETIEHVDDAAAVVAEFKRVLSPSGLLVISTPNKHEYTVENEFHTREFAPEEFARLLGDQFAHVRLSYQQNWLASTVGSAAFLGAGGGAPSSWGDNDLTLPGDDELSASLRKIAALEPGRELYTLAICSDTALPPEPAGIACLANVYEANAIVGRTIEAERLLAEWVKRAREAERVLAEWPARAATAERQVLEWEHRAKRYRMLSPLILWDAARKLISRARRSR